MQKVVVVLGSENLPDGILGSIAKDRLNKCIAVFSEEYHILCTGGWGDHFNTTEKSHASYAIEYLIGKGISKAFILPPILSGHTVEDAVMIKDFLRSISS